MNILITSTTFIPSVLLCGHCQCDYLEKQGKLNYRFCISHFTKAQDIEWADIIIFLRSDSDIDAYVSKTAKRNGIHTVYVLDDDILNAPSYLSSAPYYNLPSTKNNIRNIMSNCDTFLTPSPVLKEKYEAILSLPDVMGLAIATRCDCISDEVLDYLGVLSKKYYIVVELGLQSIWEETGKFINRGHTLFEFTSCVKRLRERGINVVVHLINGLPNETLDMMLESAKFLNTLDIQGVKFHTLMVLKDTPLEKLYNKGDIKILSKDEYIDIVIRQLEVLDPKIVIHRIISDADIDNLISPKWIVKKVSVMNDIDKEMVIRDTYQGKLFGK